MLKTLIAGAILLLSVIIGIFGYQAYQFKKKVDIAKTEIIQKVDVAKVKAHQQAGTAKEKATAIKEKAIVVKDVALLIGKHKLNTFVSDIKKKAENQ
jgi:hypothetical protein